MYKDGPLGGCSDSKNSKEEQIEEPNNIVDEENNELSEVGVRVALEGYEEQSCCGVDWDKYTHVLSYKAPTEATAFQIHIYQFTEGTWVSISEGAIYLDPELDTDKKLEGLFGIQLKKTPNFDYGISVEKHTFVLYEVKGQELDSNVAGGQVFLNTFEKIELGKEIPVAIMIYNNSLPIESNGLHDFYDTEGLEEYDLVYAVTLEFSIRE